MLAKIPARPSSSITPRAFFILLSISEMGYGYKIKKNLNKIKEDTQSTRVETSASLTKN